MKRIVLAIILTCFTLSITAQQAPFKVRKAFRQMYPENEGASWSYIGERAKEWTVRFHSGSDSLVTTFDAKANWLNTMTFIPIEDLPQAVVETVNSEYQGSSILLAVKYEAPGFDGYGVSFRY